MLSNDDLPPLGLLVNVDVKSFGLRRMKLISHIDANRLTAFSPNFWRPEKPRMMWVEENEEFVCESRLINNWWFIESRPSMTRRATI